MRSADQGEEVAVMSWGTRPVEEKLIFTYSVGVMHVGSSCGQPGDENNNIAANKWLMVPPLLCDGDTKLWL